MKKLIIRTSALTVAAGLASVAGLWAPAAHPVVHRVPASLAGQRTGSQPGVAVARTQRPAAAPVSAAVDRVESTVTPPPAAVEPPSRGVADPPPRPIRVVIPSGYGPIRTAAGFVTAASEKNGVKITYRSWNGLPGQEWRADADGTIRDAAGYCLDNTDNATTVVPRIWQCNGDDAQRWQVIPNAGMISAKGVGKTLPWTVADADYNSEPGTGVIGLDGMNITRNGLVFIPYGISSSVFQYPDEMYLDGPGNPQQTTALQEAEAQVTASATAWHSNTFRFQVEQNLCLTDPGCVSDVVAAVRYAESLGQVVVLDPNTEPSEAGTSQYDTSYPDASTTAFWQAFAPYFASDRDVILDVFNEPSHSEPCCNWSEWKSSFQSEINAIRAMGYTNQLWIETPGAEGFDDGYLYQHWSAERLTDPDHDLVYDYHHTTTIGPPENTTPDVANWRKQFGDLVADQMAPVTDGEWTNRSQGTAASPAAECWSTAPTAVPAYLAYLDAEGIGLSAWSMGDNPDGSSILNAVSGGFGSANSYPASGYTCDTGESGLYGAGADLQAWWANRT